MAFRFQLPSGNWIARFRGAVFWASTIWFASLMSVAGTSVWTGRALQVGYDGLEIVGLAHLYSAL